MFDVVVVVAYVYEEVNLEDHFSVTCSTLLSLPPYTTIFSLNLPSFVSLPPLFHRPPIKLFNLNCPVCHENTDLSSKQVRKTNISDRSADIDSLVKPCKPQTI